MITAIDDNSTNLTKTSIGKTPGNAWFEQARFGNVYSLGNIFSAWA